MWNLVAYLKKFVNSKIPEGGGGVMWSLEL